MFNCWLCWTELDWLIFLPTVKDPLYPVMVQVLTVTPSLQTKPHRSDMCIYMPYYVYLSLQPSHTHTDTHTQESHTERERYRDIQTDTTSTIRIQVLQVVPSHKQSLQAYIL